VSLGFTVPGIDFQVPGDIVVLGLVTGLTYALLGLGLTLIYKSARVLNFAHGEMGAIAASLLLFLVAQQRWSYWAALPIALLVAVAAGAFMDLIVMRRLQRASRLLVLVATVGFAQLLFVAGLFIPRAPGTTVYPTPFRASVSVGGVRLTAGHLMILAVAPVIAIALTAFLRYTRIGLASRASAENLEAAQLAGVPSRRVSLAIWVVAGLLAGISAILAAPTRTISVEREVALGPSLMLRGLTAGMIGGLSSLPLVFAAGIGIGVVEILVLFNYPTGGMLEVVLFAIVIVSLLARRSLGASGRTREEASWTMASAPPSVPKRVARHPRVRALRFGGLAAVLVFAILLPLPLRSADRVLISSIVIFAIMGLSLVVLTGYTGQVSLGQFAFVGLGAAVAGRMIQLGYPTWMGALYAVVAGGAVALVVGIPALRIRGLFLAVATLGFAVAASTWLFQQGWLVDVVSGRTSLELPRPTLFGVDLADERNYYWLCLAALVGVAAGLNRLRRTGAGRRFMAVRDNEPQAASFGISPRRTKLTAFVVSGGIAGLAGFLYGGLLVTFTDPAVFGPEFSLGLVAFVILGGVTSLSGVIVATGGILSFQHFVIPHVPPAVAEFVGLLLAGAGLLAVVIQFPEGIGGALFRLRDWVVGRLVGPQVLPEEASAPRVQLAPREPSPLPDGAVSALEAQHIVVRYGGIAAVDDVSVRAAPGEVVGLLGPNGAGKTTLFEVLSGHLRAGAGRVLLKGEDITALPPELRARLGLGRSFQEAKLFGEMTVLDSFKVALERTDPSELVPSILGLPPSRRSERAKDLRAEELLDLIGLAAHANRKVSELSTGMRRLAELGTMIALGADVLLLDEPTAGIAQREVEAFGPLLRQVREHLGATAVLITHDIPMLSALADRAYALVAGKVIAEDTPDALRRSPTVIAAYLGTDERVVRRSGALGVVTGAKA
jgi:ABC-type branched-subunit amino acid transport system ATPase component/ABC-type branched-subunit amino acid transport system permease subunit